MSNKIQIRRGLQTNLPTLDLGEPGLATDTDNFYIGGSSGNIHINASLATLSGIANNMTEIEFGSDGTQFAYDTAQTPDTLVFGLDDSVNNTLLIIEKSNIGSDYGHAQQSRPTVYIHSATNAGAATDEWLGLYHDTFDSILETGKGAIKFVSADSEIDINDNVIINGGSNPIKLGIDGTPSFIVDNDDIYIGRDLEVAGVAYFTGTVSGIELNKGDDEKLIFGDSDDASIMWDTSQTRDSIVLRTDETSRAFIISDGASDSVNLGHDNQSNPTLYIHSANANTTEWVSVTHDQTDAVIETGTGNINVKTPGKNMVLTDESGNAIDRIYVGTPGNTDGFLMYNDSGSSSVEFRRNDGTAWRTVECNNLIAAGNVGANSTSVIYWIGRSFMSSPSNGNIRLTNSSQDDFSLLQLGGTTNLFPALKRSSADIQIRLGDDSGFANLEAADITANGSLLAERLVEANTAGSGTPNVLTVSESFSVFTNEGATAENHHDLPTAVVGLQYTFIVQDSDGIQVNAASGDTIRVAGSVSSAAGNISSSTVGDAVTIVAINATEWIAISYVGTWTTA
jgi:hypothetical protein